ncbi:hypothetical protein [Frigidibacter sp. SD6-1]|uniref:hypothetical protein n=1 Tax=Frigidibacter sp. SD6-1 TaxID=3032581 RepID=UPI0024DF8964|nr:hypothetical protein [Frigidibacter sp. SD6-1]
MTVSEKELFLALLSMDAYNRGYGSAINDGVNLDERGNDIDGLGGIGSAIGSATVIQQSATEAGTPGVAAGFYAVAYDTPYGTVISYRGTDGLNPLGGYYGGSDAIHGWPIGGGFTGEGGGAQPDQLPLSLDFLQSVQASTTGGLTLTGHSLGGGLAGLWSRVLGLQATIFDPMSYLSASDSLLKHSGREASDMAGGYFMPGETLGSVLRPTGYFSERDNTNYPWLKDAGLTDAETNLAHVPSSLLPGLTLHSMAGLVLQLFSDKEELSENWASIHQEVFRALFGNNAADAIRPADESRFHEGFIAENLLRAVAYSVLDSDTLVFGSVGARAMFDDLSDLGLAVKTNAEFAREIESLPSNPMLQGGFRQAIAETVVQFAGLMALRKIEAGATGQTSGYDALQGILSFLTDGQRNEDPTTREGEILVLDLGSDIWDLTENNESASPTKAPILMTAWLDALLASQAGGSEDEILEALFGVPEALHGWTEAGLAGRYVDGVQIRTVAGSGPVKLSQEDVGSTEANRASLFFGAEGADKVEGSGFNEIFVLGAGDDEVYAGGGSDVLFGGEGSDRFTDLFAADAASGLPEGARYRDVIVGIDLAQINPGNTDGNLRYEAEDFLRWRLSETGSSYFGVDLSETNEVVFSAALSTDQAPDYATRGLEIADLKLGTVGAIEVVELTIDNLNATEEDRRRIEALFGIQKITLSERADVAKITDDWLKVPLVIDFGSYAPGEVTEADYDHVSLEPLQRGATVINGLIDTIAGQGSGSSPFRVRTH